MDVNVNRRAVNIPVDAIFKRLDQARSGLALGRMFRGFKKSKPLTGEKGHLKMVDWLRDFITL